MAQTDLAIRKRADLLQGHLLGTLLPRDQIRAIGTEPTELQIIERQTDKVLRAEINGTETIVNIEFQASHEASFPTRLLAYHGLLRQRYYPLPVRSVVVYLMHEAPVQPVPRSIISSSEDPQIDFAYDVVGLWEFPITVADVRKNPMLGPLASLTPGVATADLPELQDILEQQVRSPKLRGDLLAIMCFLASRRFDAALLQSMKRSLIMLDSPFYQEILAEGETRGKEEYVREKLIQLVQRGLGQVPAQLSTRLETMGVAQLDELFDQVLETKTAEELRKLVDALIEGG